MSNIKGRYIIVASISFLLAFALSGNLIMTVSEAAPQGEVVMAVTTLGREIWTPHQGTMAEQFPAGMWYEKLLYRGLGEDMKLYPGLAESWSISSDGLSYTFNIRKGVQFNEGWGPFTADDVLFSFKLIGRDDSQNAFRYIVTEWIKSMEVVNPYVFRVTLKEPSPEFLSYVSDYYCSMMMVSKKYYEKVGVEQASKHPVGTGPFVFKKHTVGNQLEVEAVENHWRHTPEFKTLRIKIVPEISTRIAMLKSGGADLIDLTTTALSEVERAGFHIVANPGAAYYIVVFGGQVLPKREGHDPTCPWADLENPDRARQVRKALSLAINKKEIIDYIFKKRAREFSVIQFPPGGEYTDSSWKPYPYDPTEARRLLTEAGYPSGFSKPIRMHLFTLPGRSEMLDCGEAVAMGWEKIGLKVDRVPLDWGAFRPAWYARGKIHRWGTLAFGITNYPDPITYFNTTHKSTSSALHSFENPMMDKMMNDVTLEKSLSLRGQKLKAVGQYIYDNYFACPIAMSDAIWAISGKVGGWTMNSQNSWTHNLEYIHKKK